MLWFSWTQDFAGSFPSPQDDAEGSSLGKRCCNSQDSLQDCYLAGISYSRQDVHPPSPPSTRSVYYCDVSTVLWESVSFTGKKTRQPSSRDLMTCVCVCLCCDLIIGHNSLSFSIYMYYRPMYVSLCRTLNPCIVLQHCNQNVQHSQSVFIRLHVPVCVCVCVCVCVRACLCVIKHSCCV